MPWRRLREIIRARDGLIRLCVGFSGQTMIQFNEWDHSLESLFEHDLIRKPGSTFRDHA
jgi:hypothetical protein